MTRILFSSLLTLLLASCGKRDLKNTAPANFHSIEATSIAPKCLQCHQSLATYDGVKQIVNPGDAANSRLYQEVSSGDMPRQSTALSDAEIAAIYTWIQNGANND